MDFAGGENHNSSIENLKLFALSTHEELKSLHSKNLFKNFSNNQFEILLEDLKNCNYDENKWGIQKRVEWHILNSLNSTENEQYNNGLKNSEKSNEVKKNTNRRANLSPTHSTLKKSPFTPTHVANRGETLKKISDTKYEHRKLWKSNKEQGRCNIQNQTQFCGHNLSTMKNNTRFGDKSMPYKSVNLEMVSIPHINILPLSKDALPYISIEPSVSYNELPPKSRPISQLLRKKFSSKLTNLEKIKNVSIDIPPLDKQKLQSINVPPCKSRTSNYVNQAVYEYKYQGMSSDEEINPVFVESNHGKTYSNTRVKISDTKIVNSTVSKNIDNDHYTNTRGHRVDNFDTDRFYGDRFIDRLEKRLKSILPPPNKKFVAPKQSDRSVQVGAPKSDLSVQVEGIEPPFKGISLSEDSSNSGELKIPPPDFIKTSSETQTPYVFKADKFVQASLIQDYNSETSVSSTCKENNVIDDQESNSENQEPQKLVEVSRSNGNRKRVAFDLDQFSPSENIVKKEDEDVDENSKKNSSDASINSSTTTTTTTTNNNNNNKDETKDLKSDVMLRNEPSETKSISNNEKNSYDNKYKQNENSSKPCANNTPTIKNIQEKPPLYIQDNNVELETLQHLKGSPTVSNEEQSLYSLSFNSGSAENELPNEEVHTPERISNEEQQISSFSNISTKHEDRAEGEDSHHILKETKSSELESEEETILPSIEIGDVTISEGEIEFEASIADVQPCNRIAIKISTKDLGMTTIMKDYCPDLANKETQTSLTHIENTLDLEATVCDSSFSEGFLLKSESKNQTKKNGLRTSGESYNETVQDVSEGELIGEITPILDDDEKQFLLIENEKLLKRLSGITGRFLCR